MSGTKGDPKLYRELLKPFESAAAVNEALEAFHKELGDLRKKYKLPNGCVITDFTYLASDGEESAALWHASFGDALIVEGMLAFALG